MSKDEEVTPSDCFRGDEYWNGYIDGLYDGIGDDTNEIVKRLVAAG